LSLVVPHRFPLLDKHEAGFPGTDPLTLPGLELYLRSDISLYRDSALTQKAASGDVVLGVKDFSPFGRSAVTSVGLSNPPMCSAGSSPTGRDLLQFFGQQNAGQLFGPLPVTPIDNSNGYTLYLWIKEESLANPFDSSGQRVIDMPIGNGFNCTPEDRTFSAGCNLCPFLIGPPDVLGVQLWVVSLPPPLNSSGNETCMLEVNGVVSGAQNPQTSSKTIGLNSEYILSGNSGGRICFAGKFGAFILYSRAHDAATISGVKTFLTAVLG
jgi:hypothetical protein